MKTTICQRLFYGLALAFGLGACSVTSPYWGYEPASTSTAIPFQAFATSTATPVVVECADDTNAHGWPTDGEASYIVAASLPVSTSAMLDSTGGKIYSASGNVVLPSTCWKYFGEWGFWQANIRVSQVVPAIGGGTTKRIYSSYDLTGLACLGQKTGAGASWFAALGQGCEKTYLDSDEQIPYIVLRFDGDSSGAGSSEQSAKVTGAAKRAAKKFAADSLEGAGPAVQQIVPLTREQQQQLQQGIKTGAAASAQFALPAGISLK